MISSSSLSGPGTPRFARGNQQFNESKKIDNKLSLSSVAGQQKLLSQLTRTLQYVPTGNTQLKSENIVGTGPGGKFYVRELDEFTVEFTLQKEIEGTLANSYLALETSCVKLDANGRLALQAVELRNAQKIDDIKQEHYSALIKARSTVDDNFETVGKGGASNLDVLWTADNNKVGYKHCAVFMDGYSSHRVVLFCKSRDEFVNLIAEYAMTVGANFFTGGELTIRYVHCEGAREFNSKAMQATLLKAGLAINVTTSPHSPASNGIAEANVKSLVAGTRARLAMAGLRPRFWPWAMLTAIGNWQESDGAASDH